MTSSFFKRASDSVSSTLEALGDRVSDAVGYIKEHQPIHITGTVPHSFSWLISSFTDQFIPNPQFDSSIDKNKQCAIFAVHGTADRNVCFKKFSSRLVTSLTSLVSGVHLPAFDYRGTGKGIEVFAKQLLDKILASGAKHVILMGHSRGSLVAAYLKEYFAEELKKADVTIDASYLFAAPLWGCGYAIPPLTYLSTSVAQMQVGSEFLANLRAKMVVSEKQSAKYRYLVAGHDSLVNEEAAYLEHHAIRKQNHVCFPRHGHLSLLSSQQAVKYVSHDVNALYVNAEEKSEYKVTDEMQHVEERTCAVVGDVCFLINTLIIELSARFHIFSIDRKVNVLENLKKAIVVLYDEEKPEKTTEKTLGGFIEKYLDTPDAQGIKPYSVLSEQLNIDVKGSVKSLLGRFSRGSAEESEETKTKTASLIFIESIVERYKEALLPGQVKEVACPLPIIR